MVKQDGVKSEDGETYPGPIPDNVPTWTSARYCLAYLSFFGHFIAIGSRAILSVTIVAMLNSTGKEPTNISECRSVKTNENISTHRTGEFNWTNNQIRTGEFNWTNNQIGQILGSSFYGQICSIMIGGLIATRYGGKYVTGGGVLCSTICTLLLPAAARSFPFLIASRVMLGIGEGMTYPGLFAMWGIWFPPQERSKLSSFSYSGMLVGIAVSQPIAGLLSASTLLGGWPSVFYMYGTIGLIWCLLWFSLAHNKPNEHPRISVEELDYINVSQEQTTSNIPWGSILKSYPVWAIVIARMSFHWGYYTLITCLPIYLKSVLGFDVSQSGIISSLPYIAMMIMTNVAGFIADAILQRGILNTTQTRKIFTGIGFIGSAIFLIAAGYAGCNNSLAITFICIAGGCMGVSLPGFNANKIDVSPRYVGIIVGLSNIVGFSSSLPPIVAQKIAGNNGTLEQWRHVFFIVAAIYLFGTILFSIMASGVEQDWNQSKYDQNEQKCKLAGETEPLLDAVVLEDL